MKDLKRHKGILLFLLFLAFCFGVLTSAFSSAAADCRWRLCLRPSGSRL